MTLLILYQPTEETINSLHNSTNLSRIKVKHCDTIDDVNSAIIKNTSKSIIIVSSQTKFQDNWLDPISFSDKAISCPSIYNLDEHLWASSGKKAGGIRLRPNLSLRRISVGESSVVSPVFAFTKPIFDLVGGFRSFSDFGSSLVDFSFRCKSNGINIAANNRCYVACDDYKIGDKRLVSAWYGKYATWHSKQFGSAPRFGFRVDKEFSLSYPEFKILDLAGSAAGRSVAILGPGNSMDAVDFGMLNSYDILIGVDYTGLYYECDYVVATDTVAIEALAQKYYHPNIICPDIVTDFQTSKLIPSSTINDSLTQFELAQFENPKGIFPPFSYYFSTLHPAIHFALMLGPKSVTVFGSDIVKIGDKSVFSPKFKEYKEEDYNIQKLHLVEYGFKELGNLACSIGTPLLLVRHA